MREDEWRNEREVFGILAVTCFVIVAVAAFVIFGGAG